MEQRIQDLQLQALPTAPTYSTPKPNKPPTYMGKREESIETWIKQMERYFRLTKIPEEEQVEWAAYYLTGSAASWFEVEHDQAEISGNPLTWDILTTRLRK